jgi:hypothetical protein
MQAEEARGQQARREQRVRLRVPQGIGRMNLLHLNVAADGTCEMLESEAESFLRAGWERVEAGDSWSSQQARDPQKPEPLSVIAKPLVCGSAGPLGLRSTELASATPVTRYEAITPRRMVPGFAAGAQ